MNRYRYPYLALSLFLCQSLFAQITQIAIEAETSGSDSLIRDKAVDELLAVVDSLELWTASAEWAAQSSLPQVSSADQKDRSFSYICDAEGRNDLLSIKVTDTGIRIAALIRNTSSPMTTRLEDSVEKLLDVLDNHYESPRVEVVKPVSKLLAE